jgi:hypothetical protein
MSTAHVIAQQEATRELLKQLDHRIAVLEMAANDDRRRILALEALVEKRLDPDLILEAFAKNLKGPAVGEDSPPAEISVEDIPF